MSDSVIIAAVDTVDPSSADYVCDGVNDEVELMSALAEVMATPSVTRSVTLLDGHFNFDTDDAVYSGLEYTTIEGQGVASTVIQSVAENAIMLGTGSNDCVINDIKFDGMNLGNWLLKLYAVSSVEAFNLEFTRNTADALLISGSDDVYIHDVICHDSAGIIYGGGLDCGIEAQYSTNITIEDCEVSDYEVGISFHRHSGEGAITGLNAINCYCHDNGQFNYFVGNIEWTTDTDMLTTDCHYTGCTGGAIIPYASYDSNFKAEYVNGLWLDAATIADIKTNGYMFDNCIHTKIPTTLTQAGVVPTYEGASFCNSQPLLTDTFDNTGNELILLKNYGTTTATHNITVTSTDALTHEDYTIALLPTRGTFIGPYPLDDYGVLPTITYDDMNMWVSIFKVAEYSP